MLKYTFNFQNEKKTLNCYRNLPGYFKGSLFPKTKSNVRFSKQKPLDVYRHLSWYFQNKSPWLVSEHGQIFQIKILKFQHIQLRVQSCANHLDFRSTTFYPTLLAGLMSHCSVSLSSMNPASSRCRRHSSTTAGRESGGNMKFIWFC